MLLKAQSDTKDYIRAEGDFHKEIQRERESPTALVKCIFVIQTLFVCDCVFFTQIGRTRLNVENDNNKSNDLSVLLSFVVVVVVVVVVVCLFRLFCFVQGKSSLGECLDIGTRGCQSRGLPYSGDLL